MANVSINSTGATIADMTFYNAADLFVTDVDGDSGEDNFTSFQTNNANGDRAIVTEAGAYGIINFTKNLNVYGSSDISWTANTRVPNGAQCTSIDINGTSEICNLYISGENAQAAVLTSNGAADLICNRVIAIAPVARHGFYKQSGSSFITRNCIVFRDDAGTGSSYVIVDAYNCLEWQIGAGNATSNGFWFCNVFACISMRPQGDCYDTSVAIDDGYNMSSDATAPGATKFTSVSEATIFANVGAGTEDPQWVDETTAALYTSSDPGSYTGSVGDIVRVNWNLGPYEFDSGGGGGSEDWPFGSEEGWPFTGNTEWPLKPTKPWEAEIV